MKTQNYLSRHSMIRTGPWAVLIVVSMLAADTRGDPPGSAVPVSIDVVASGVGRDESEATRNALLNAVSQAVGTIVDAETVVKDDQIIREQILTASSAIVSKYDPVGAPKAEGGLVSVRIKATVERHALTQRLEAANVITRPVEGKDLFAQAVTELQKEQDAAKIVHKVFEGFPGNVLRAEPVGEPRLVQTSGTDATIGVTVRFQIDPDKYAAWVRAFVPVLSKVAARSESVRFEPADLMFNRRPEPRNEDIRILGLPFSERRGLDKRWRALSIEHDASAKAFHVVGNIGLLPAKYAHEDLLVVVDRAQGGKAVFLTLDHELAHQVLQAAYAMPIVDVSMKDARGEDLAGRTRPACFGGGGTSLYATPFWMAEFMIGEPGSALSSAFDHGGTRPWGPHDANDWKPDQTLYPWVLNAKEQKILILPFIGGSQIICPSFCNEFEFQLPRDRVKDAKSVRVEISSHSSDGGPVGDGR